MSSRRLLPYKDAIINLYKHVGNEPFYTQDVAHIFPAQRINMLTNREFLAPTGNFRRSGTATSHNRKYNEWRFTSKGIAFAESFK